MLILSFPRIDIHKLQHNIIIFSQKVRHFSAWVHVNYQLRINKRIAEFFYSINPMGYFKHNDYANLCILTI
jgi:hypothetical protein